MSLRKFLTLGLIANEATICGIRRPLGYSQIVNATLAASTGIVFPALPAGVTVGLAIIQVQGGSIRWRDDGTAPTSAVGMTLPSGGELDYVGDFYALRFISASGTPIVDVSLYA